METERAVAKERRISPEVAANYTRVLDVAARVFEEKGYHAATMQDIADEADLTKGGLYHYLTGKAETLFAINERYLLAGTRAQAMRVIGNYLQAIS